MIIQHNLLSLFTSNQLNINSKKRVNSAEKLSSGYRINRAADDAAGLSISEKMRAQIRGLSQAAENIQDGISYAQVADGALQEVTNIMQRIRVLSVQASNDISTDNDRDDIDTEIQQLKKGIDTIFHDTEFNTIKVWDTNTDNKVQIGTEPKQAVTMNNPSQMFTITDKNKGAVAYSSYKINVMGTDQADTENYGIRLTWTGYNGNEYSTNLIDWDTINGSNVNFNISDYLDVSNNQELEGISFEISYNVTESATINDIAKALDGVVISSSPITSQSITNTQNNSDISLGVDISYLAELASGRIMDHYDTAFMSPNLSGTITNNVTTPDYDKNPIDSTGLSFRFNMNNIGTVTANSTNLYYYSNDTSAATEGKWWKYVTYGNNTYQSTLTYSPAIPGTGLDSILSCLNREDGYSVTKDANANGYIVLSFNLSSDSTYNYGGKTSNNIGTITVGIHVSDNDTQEDLIDKIRSSFNEDSIIDIFAGTESDNSPSDAYNFSYGGEARTSIIDVPIYQACHDVAIQVGANSNESIHFVYDSLRTTNLGIANVNTQTRINASNAISEIDKGLAIVNEQRSLFGAYENRLEHAYSNSMNTAENLQNSESRIRDLDVADEIIENSKRNILEQTITSILTQNNQNIQNVLKLLE